MNRNFNKIQNKSREKKRDFAFRNTDKGQLVYSVVNFSLETLAFIPLKEKASLVRKFKYYFMSSIEAL
jgi:hypothetical protein